jgi:hypothetical protein
MIFIWKGKNFEIVKEKIRIRMDWLDSPRISTSLFNVVFISNVIVNEHIVIVNNNNIQYRRNVDVSLLQFVLRFLFRLFPWRDKDRSNRSIRTLGSCLRRKIDQFRKRVSARFKAIKKKKKKEILIANKINEISQFEISRANEVDSSNSIVYKISIVINI